MLPLHQSPETPGLQAIRLVWSTRPTLRICDLCLKCHMLDGHSAL
jgi:hypothetical protein